MLHFARTTIAVLSISPTQVESYYLFNNIHSVVCSVLLERSNRGASIICHTSLHSDPGMSNRSWRCG